MIDILQKAAAQTGELLLKYFERGVKAQYKTSFKDIVTEADLESQKTVIETISRALRQKGIPESDYGFIGEENMHEVVTKKYLFVIDPIDGTTNFESKLPHFCVSLALFENGVLSKGVIYIPLTNTFFIAERGRGAFKIVGSKKTQLQMISRNLQQSLLVANAEGMASVGKNVLELQKEVKNIRILGSVCVDLCYLAENVFQMAIEIGCKIWDLAAVDVIVKEAGGMVVDLQGNELEYDLSQPTKKYSIISSHPTILPEVLKYF